MGKTVDYVFSAGSPWTYFGHWRFQDIARRSGATIKVKPVDFGRIFPLTGVRPLGERPVQHQAYRLVELKRFRDHLKMPLNLKPKFSPVPRDPSALLIIAADRIAGTDAAMQIAGALMRACWAEDRDNSDPATLMAICREQGMDADKLSAEAKSPAVRKQYETYTEEALALNVFGAPSYIIDGEIFWGQDRLDFVERRLSAAAN